MRRAKMMSVLAFTAALPGVKLCGQSAGDRMPFSSLQLTAAALSTLFGLGQYALPVLLSRKEACWQ